MSTRRRPVPQHTTLCPLAPKVAEAVAFLERDQLVDEAERYTREAADHGQDSEA